MIVWIIAIGFLIYYLAKGKEGPPPPKIVEPNYVSPKQSAHFEAKRIEREKRERYEEDHFYDVYLECWIKKIDDDYFVRSCSYEDWDDGMRDEFERVEPVWYVEAWEYEDDPEWAEKERQAHHAWIHHGLY